MGAESTKVPGARGRGRREATSRGRAAPQALAAPLHTVLSPCGACGACGAAFTRGGGTKPWGRWKDTEDRNVLERI